MTPESRTSETATDAAAAASQEAPIAKMLIRAGYVVSALVVLMLTFSAVMKFVQPDDFKKEFDRLEYPLSLGVPIGMVEVVCTVLYVIPQTSVLGAILLTGYLGGATATHVRIHDAFIPPVIGGVLVWLGLYLRDPRIRALIPLKTS